MKKKNSFFSDFKDFIARGNVIELAVAVIMGGAFGKIVSSLVSDIVMPLVGIFIGDDFSSLSAVIEGSTIHYGLFIQNVVDFLIIAFFIFTVTRGISKVTAKLEAEKKKEKEEKKEEKPSEEVLLLREIRNELKKKK